MTPEQITAELQRKASLGIAPTDPNNLAQYNQIKTSQTAGVTTPYGVSAPNGGEMVTDSMGTWYRVNGQDYNMSRQPQTQQSQFQQQMPQVQDNSALIRQMYEEQKSSALAQLKQAIASSKSKYQINLNESPDKYRKLRNAVSTNYYKGVSPLREALANTGNLNSGMGRQEQLEAATGMQNNINDLNTQQQQYENEINTAITDLENSGSLQEAQIASDNASKLIEALMSEGNRVSSESYQRLQNALNRSDKLSELGYNRSQDTASSMGYVNPYAQYVVTPDIQTQLAPYTNDYAAFIRDNPNSWLVPYAQNARFQKMLGSGSAYAGELANYRSPDYIGNQLENEYRQAQINSTNALANNRSSGSSSGSSTTVLNSNYQDALSQYSNVGGEEMYAELTSNPEEMISQVGTANYNKLIEVARAKYYSSLQADWANSDPADIVSSLLNDADYFRSRLGDTYYYKLLTEAKGR